MAKGNIDAGGMQVLCFHTQITGTHYISSHRLK